MDNTMRVTGCQTTGKSFTISVENDLFRYRFNLRGGMMSTERKAVDTGMTLATMSWRMFLNAEIIALSVSCEKVQGDPQGFAKTLSDKDGAWKYVDPKSVIALADMVRNMALMVPETCMGFQTGSKAVKFADYQITDHVSNQTARMVLQEVPLNEFGGKDDFLHRWAVRTMSNSERFSFYDNGIVHANSRVKIIDNDRALVALTPEWRETVREEAMRMATSHLIDNVPLMTSGRKAIRGEHAASLLNLTVPGIQAEIRKISDPEIRDMMLSRIDRLADRVAMDSTAKTEMQRMHDINLSIEVLEEQVENRLAST